VDLCLIRNDSVNNLTKFSVDDSHLSHHCKLNLQLGQANVKEKQKECEKIKWTDAYKLKFLEQLRKIGKELEQTTYNDFCSLIYKAARASGMKTTGNYSLNNQGPLWSDRELLQYKRSYRLQVTVFRKCNPSTDINEFLEAKKLMLQAKTVYLELTREKR